MRRRLFIIGIAVLSIALCVIFLWGAYRWPPVRLVAEFGLPPVGGPTGQQRVVAGIRFVEVSPGYRHVRRAARLDAFTEMLKGDAFDENGVRGWVEIQEAYWIAESEADGILRDRLGRIMGTGLEPEALWNLGAEAWGSFRLPTKAELWFAADSGALVDLTRSAAEWVQDDRNPGQAVRILVGDFWKEARGTEEFMAALGQPLAGAGCRPRRDASQCATGQCATGRCSAGRCSAGQCAAGRWGGGRRGSGRWGTGRCVGRGGAGR